MNGLTPIQASLSEALSPQDKNQNLAAEWSARNGIFSYLNYREYLAQWFSARKKLQPGYSGAIFAKKAGLSSHTLLGMVIRGDRNLSASTTRGFIRALGIKGKEALYFEKLVLFNQSKNSDDRAYYFDQLSAASSNTTASELITQIKNHANYFSHWYVVAIEKLVELDDFNPDPEWIADKLKNKITKRQAESAWNLLLDLGMVSKVSDGETITYRNESRPIDVAPGTVDFAIRNFHKEYLDRAKDAIDGDSFEDRTLSSLTIAVSEEDFPKLKEKIDDFRKEMNLKFSDSAKQKTKVVAVNMQALILSATTSQVGKKEGSKT